MPESNTIHTIGPDGQLRVVERTVPIPAPTAAQLVAEKLQVPYDSEGDNGELTTSQAGRIGGNLGGPMVAKLVSMAKQEIANAHVQDLIARQKK